MDEFTGFLWMLEMCSKGHVVTGATGDYKMIGGVLKWREHGSDVWLLATITAEVLAGSYSMPMPAPPKPGSLDWALAQPAGTCFWFNDDYSVYYKKNEKGDALVCVYLDQPMPSHCCSRMNPFTICTWDGEQVEPAPGSKFWAYIMCVKLGKQVVWGRTKDRYKCIHGQVHYWNTGSQSWRRQEMIPTYLESRSYLHGTDWRLFDDLPIREEIAALEEKITKLKAELC